MTQASAGRRAYRAGVGVAAIASLLVVWTTIVRDDGDGIGYFMVVMAAMVGSFAAWFRAAGAMRAMLGVAAMQMLLGVAIATAPSTAKLANGPTRALAVNAVFAGLWLVASTLFGVAARVAAEPTAGDRRR